MQDDLRNYTIAALQGFFADEIEYFIDKYEKNPDALVNLVMTLKYWANPLGAYPSDLFSDKQLKENFPEIPKVIKNPALILPNHAFSNEDKKEIRELIRIRLNSIANELIQKYKLDKKINEKIKLPTPTEWWKNLSEDTQRQIQAQYRSLTEEQQAIIKRKTSAPLADEKKPERNSQPQPHYDIYIPSYYYMCNHNAYLDYVVMDGLIRVTAATIRAGIEVAAHIPTCGNCGNCNCNGDGCIPILAGAALLAIVSSGIVGGMYALSKAAKSLYDLFQGKKICRSIARLMSIGIGGYSGAAMGGIIGGALGSVIPGLGTAIGALVGTIFGSLLVAGLAALVAKYTARYISSELLAEENMNVPTNPEKYNLTSDEKNIIIEKQLDVRKINKMMLALYNEKKQIPPFCGSVPGTTEYNEKKRLNNLLKQIKKGEIAAAYLDHKNFDATTEGNPKDYFAAFSHSIYGKNSSGVHFFPAPSAPPGDLPIPSAPPEWMVSAY